MTKTEIQALKNIAARLKEQNCGCSNSNRNAELVAECNKREIEAVSRIYLDTWIISALDLLIEGGNRNAELARSLSSK
ncbi:hypothetical protein BcepF1.018 [Burkholderia phage BcepF1]|uniref:Uncharacterized protein n=1 Tax=Burkholderia phage BcepF1 TaxID=2886897 RepID=A1YZS2_9CAUD|nr:hypothetical protein BcepF1.018 [Burkholderia phage BcepF1]ABL96749.1 hypothetical protein BcepF1.018 [Burkholderia phage BcepF1]